MMRRSFCRRVPPWNSTVITSACGRRILAPHEAPCRAPDMMERSAATTKALFISSAAAAAAAAAGTSNVDAEAISSCGDLVTAAAAFRCMKLSLFAAIFVSSLPALAAVEQFTLDFPPST